MWLTAFQVLLSTSLFMNILHVISAKKEVPVKVKKLQSSCRDPQTCPSLTFSKEELKERLSPLEYHVTQEKGTEKAFSGKYVHWNEEGVYNCRVCGNELFSSDTKFDSKSGWPSFSDVVDRGRVTLKEDTSHGMKRTEVLCSVCGAHLGHVFDDGPAPTGLRYCMNSAALAFQGKDEDKENEKTDENNNEQHLKSEL